MKHSGIILMFGLAVSLASGLPMMFPGMAFEEEIDPVDLEPVRFGPVPPLLSAKRQFHRQPPRFSSVKQFDAYMKQLESYLKLLGRQRFGKRSGKLDGGDQTKEAIEKQLKEINNKLNLLLH